MRKIMEDNIMTYVIIGDGVAGMTAAQEVRKIDKDSQIKILSEEKYLPYYRVKLSHFISKSFKPEDLLIHNDYWYRERNIDVSLNTKVKGVDVINSRVVLENGDNINYNKLLIATGSSSFIPPVEGADKNGVYALRSLYDLQNIQAFIKNCEEVAVVGGGLLGLEAAWALMERGLTVHVVEFSPYLLSRQLDEELATHIMSKLEEKGLKIHLSAASQEILGEESVTGILLKDGREIKADMVLFSTGVRPNINILPGSDIAINKGVIVDDRMRTSHKDIYAAGDVAEFNGVILSLWSVATDQGKIAGKNMAGEEESYALPQPATLLNIGEISAFSVGEIKENMETLSHHEGDVFHKLFIEDGKLIGGVLTGDVKKMVVLKKAVNSKADLSSFLKQGMGVEEILNNI